MIETVATVDLMVEEELKVKKNHLAPDFPTGNEKRICIVSGLYGDELQDEGDSGIRNRYEFYFSGIEAWCAGRIYGIMYFRGYPGSRCVY